MIGICFLESLEYSRIANEDQEIFRKCYAEINFIKKAGWGKLCSFSGISNIPDCDFPPADERKP